MNADEVYEALKRRHQLPEWVLVRELRLGTGFGQIEDGDWQRYLAGDRKRWPRYKMQQRIDAWALNCYKSKGFVRIAYEIKVAHSDFIAEKLDPQKRQGAQEISDYFYFAAPRGVIAPMELPKDCGLLVVEEDGRTRILKKAPRLSPSRLDWRLVASLTRNISQARRKDLPKDRFSTDLY